MFFATAPAPVQSIAAGSVAYAGPLEGYGNMVVIDHGDGYVSVYSGLSGVSVAGRQQRIDRQQYRPQRRPALPASKGFIWKSATAASR